MYIKRILLYTIYAGLPVGILAETIKRQKLLTIFSLTEKVEKVLQSIFGTLVRRSPLSQEGMVETSQE